MSPTSRRIIAFLLALAPSQAFAAESGLITVQSKYAVTETIRRFEAAINANADQGWKVFTEIDHMEAAEREGSKLLPRTVIVFGNPRLGTPAMAKAATIAIDLPQKALVWQDDQGKVWLTYNSGQYLQGQVFPRHGLSASPEGAASFDKFLKQVSEQATQ
jgi:uncharacterized protein (DUF302 family)